MAQTVHQFAQVVAAETKRPIYETEETIRVFFELLARSLAAGGGLTVHNFGTFERRQIAAHKGHNIYTQQAMTVPAQYVARFRPTGQLKVMVRDGDTAGTTRKNSSRRNVQG